LETNVRNNKGRYVQISLDLGKHFVEIREFQKALKVLLKAKDVFDKFRGVNDNQIAFDIEMNLGNCYFYMENGLKAYEVYKVII